MKTEDIKSIAAAWARVQEAARKKMDPVDKDELKGTHDDREDGDIDNDGDEDKSDEYLHKRRKAVSKAMKKEDTNTSWPVYKRIMEKMSHTAGATPPEDIDSKENPGGKKMRSDMKADNPEVDDTETKGYDDVSKAGRVTKKSPMRGNDNAQGDKIDIPKDTTKG